MILDPAEVEAPPALNILDTTDRDAELVRLCLSDASHLPGRVPGGPTRRGVGAL